MSILWYLASFIVALGILIAVHEFGHFWVARRMGVKVLRFSIGFGKPIWSYTSKKDGTEYVVAMIPLGGYVKMLGEGDDEIAPEEMDQAFSRKSVYRRFAIVFAGPLFNLVFAMLVYAGMNMYGVSQLAPVVGQVPANSRAEQGGFRRGDTVLEQNGSMIASWQQFRLGIYNGALSSEKLVFRVRDTESRLQTRILETGGLRDILEEKDLLGKLGFRPWLPPAVLGKVIRGKPADKAGLREGDRIVSINGKPVVDWGDVSVIIGRNHGKLLKIKYIRDNNAGMVELVPELVEHKGRKSGKIGVYWPKTYRDKMFVMVEYGPAEAFSKGVAQTWQMSVLMLKALLRVVSEGATKSISGPITIGKFAGESASRGWLQFFSFLAVISISLGVLNLLPIPMLDGGHLMFYLVEMVKGSPVSDKVQIVAQKLGIMILLLLMGLAFYNDIVRFF